MGIFTITVEAHERAVTYVDGRVSEVLGPGRHRRRWRTRYAVVDLRERITSTAAQELLTSDGVAVKITAAIRWRVVDPVAFQQVARDPEADLYLAAQLVLREELVSFDVADLLRQGREAVAQSASGQIAPAAERLGVEVGSLVIKDVVLPAELRSAYAELVTARQRGLARLETARAETAALRSLANGAKLLDDHPALAQLRMIEAAPYGTKVVLHLPDGDSR